MVRILSFVPAVLLLPLLTGCSFFYGRSPNRGGYGGISKDSSWFFTPETIGLLSLLFIVVLFVYLDRRARA